MCCVHLAVLGTKVAALHRAHTSSFCSALQVPKECKVCKRRSPLKYTCIASAPLTNFEKKHNNGPKDTTTSSVFRASYWPGAVTRSRKGREGRGRTGGIVQVLRPAHRVAARGSSHCCQSASRAAPHLLLLHTNVRPSRSRRPPAVESFCALHPPGSASEQRTRWAVCRAVYSTKRATTSSRS